MFFVRFFLSLVVSSLISFNAVSSDHIDGAATIDDGQADLTDLYAFKSADSKGFSVVLNMYPGVKKNGHFSSKVSYEIFLKEASFKKPPLKKGFNVSVENDLTLNCKFKDHDHNKGVSVKGLIFCDLEKNGVLIDSVSGEVGEELNGRVFRIFSGPRTDSFFISAGTFLKVTGRKKFKAEKKGSVENSMNQINVLSIAVEFDTKALSVEDKLLAVAARSYTTHGHIIDTLDRVGRPEITNLSLHDHSSKNPLKRKYNSEMQIFYNSDYRLDVFRQRLVDNISAYDSLDRKRGLRIDQIRELSDLLVEDFLVIDLGALCDKKNSFFSIEKKLLYNIGSGGCGGRKITDDIMATLYGLYIGGPRAEVLDFESGVSFPYQNNDLAKLSDKFPYLAPSGDTSWRKRFLFNVAKALQE